MLVRIALVGLMLAFFSPSANAGEPYKKKFGDWEVLCSQGVDHPDACGVGLSVIDPKGPWIKAYTTYDGPWGLQIALILPHEAEAGETVAIRLDDKPLGILFVKPCIRKVCIVMWNLNKPETDSLLLKSELGVQYRISPTAGVEFFFSVKDLKEALAHLAQVTDQKQ